MCIKGVATTTMKRMEGTFEYTPLSLTALPDSLQVVYYRPFSHIFRPCTSFLLTRVVCFLLAEFSLCNAKNVISLIVFQSLRSSSSSLWFIYPISQIRSALGFF